MKNEDRPAKRTGRQPESVNIGEGRRARARGVAVEETTCVLFPKSDPPTLWVRTREKVSVSVWALES